MNTEELKAIVASKVREELQGRINAPKQTTVSEGWGDNVLKVAAMTIGAAVVLPIAFWASLAVGGSLAAVIASAGFVNAATIVGGVVGTSSALAILGAGGKVGLHVSRRVMTSDATEAATRLVEITNKRDAVVEKLVKASGDKQLEARAAVLTDKQIRAGRELEKAALADFRKGLINMQEYSKQRDVAMVAKLGKLTYLHTN